MRQFLHVAQFLIHAIGRWSTHLDEIAENDRLLFKLLRRNVLSKNCHERERDGERKDREERREREREREREKGEGGRERERDEKILSVRQTDRPGWVTVYRTNRGEMLGGHLREHCVKVSLVFVIDQTIMEHSLRLVAEQTEHLRLLSNHASVCLQNT